MKVVVVILMLLIAVLLLLAIIALVVLWFGGAEVIALPGLGILIATPLLIALFVALEVILVLCASLLWRLSS